MKEHIYYVLHVLGIILFACYTFANIRNTDTAKKRGLHMRQVVMGLVALTGGFGLLAVLELKVTDGWVLVKIGVWVALFALAGVSYKNRALAAPFSALTVALLALAIYMAHAKPI